MTDQPTKPQTKVVSARVPQEFYNKLIAKLEENDESMSSVIIAALEEYVGETFREPGLEEVLLEHQQAIEALRQEVASLKREPAPV